MASTSNQLTDPRCSSSSSSTLWDVFLSFAGKDTRNNFTSHLYKALDQHGIQTFMDDSELSKGEEISSELPKAIRDSKMFVVVISENYASSSWCLNELLEILDCKRTKGLVVIPVFFYVDPSTVRYQIGSFGVALEKHKKRQSSDMLEKWISALSEIAEISGYHLKKDTDKKESDIIQEIVEKVERGASTNVQHIEEHLYGIDSAVEEIYQKLRMESNDVRAIGIWGMGGIGKTTTAKAFYNKYSNKYDISCFIEGIQQKSQDRSTLLGLLEQLLNELLGRKDCEVRDVDSGIRHLKKILSSNKALIVLDDLDQSSYWKLLVRLCNSFSAGSRVMITTRDEKIINQLQVDIPGLDVYKVKELGQKESLMLFSYHAFRKTVPTKSFRELSLSFVSYARGLPLALKVLGSFLCGTPDVSFWQEKLKKVRQIPDGEIQKILQLSYDGLSDEMQKAIFLDIVFFFLGKDKDDAIHVFKSCEFFPDVGIPVLVQRCLLTIDEDNKFQMHNLIQHMGREIIREESGHGLCRRLYVNQENAWETLQKLEGTQKTEGLILDLSKSTNKQVSTKIFEKLPKLRLLHIIDVHNINGNFKNSFHELRCFRWHHCPWTHLPSSFHPIKLVSLDMPFSELKTLWKGSMSLVNLKTINVSYSKNLKKTPNVRNANFVEKLLFRGCIKLLSAHPTIVELTNLGHLDLGECNHLIELPEAIGEFTQLGHLDLRDCVNLKRLPQTIKRLTNMSSLNMGGCRSLKRLPEQLGEMKCLKKLDASDTAIEQLPDSTVQLSQLVTLNLFGCKKLKKLPEQLGEMKCLKKLDASYTAIEQLPGSTAQLRELVWLDLYGCKKLKKLPEQFGKLEGLERFDAGDSALEELPDSFVCLSNLVKLKLSWCSKLKRLPDQFGKLQCLESLGAGSTAIEELPDSIGLLTRLKKLDLNCCKRLTYLPNSIGNLTSLQYLGLDNIDKIELADTVKNMKLERIGLNNIRSCMPVILNLSFLKELELGNDCQDFSSTKPFSLSKLQTVEYISCTNFGSTLPEFPMNLKRLFVFGNATLEDLPDLSSYEKLQRLSIRRCNSLRAVTKLPPNLESLSVGDCKSLQNLPDLSLLKELMNLRVTECSNLKSVRLKQSSLQMGRKKYPNFRATIPNTEIAEWLRYTSKGCTVSFNFPHDFGDNFAVVLWVVYKIKYTSQPFNCMRAIITNKTEGISKTYNIHASTEKAGVVQSTVSCIGVRDMLVKSGDAINVSFQSPMYSYPGEEVVGEVAVNRCGAHVIKKMYYSS